ncbi:MAG: GGDEF domain-containing protein [Lachnospiraceae bacterium]|nr:GGDEF domain-containing protein [Lachnospiraceae bacterium]
MSGRKKVGVFVANCHMDHPKKIIKSIYKGFLDKNVDVHFFLGTESRSFYRQISTEGNDFDYQYLSLYDYSNFETFDLLIIGYGSLNTFQKLMDKETFLNKFSHIPCIILEDNTTPKTGINIIADNYSGMRQCVEHLIHEHHYNNIVYLSGPEGNDDAQERLQAYLDVMIENGLPVDDDMIEYGDFSEDVEDKIHALFDHNENIDAIVCANDEMSTTAYRVCAEKGLKVGEDIAITGFDNMRWAWCAEPGLTTAEQKSGEMGYRAVELGMDILAGKKVSSERIPTGFIVRGSCGCKGDHAQSTTRREENNIQNALEEMKETWSQAISGPLMLRELIQAADNEVTIYSLISQMLLRQGAKYSSLCLLENPMLNVEDKPYILAENLRQVFRQEGDKYHVYEKEKAPIIERAQGLIPTHKEEDESHIYFSYLIFDGNRQYGILTTEIFYKDVPNYYLTTLQIGTALHFMELLQQSHEDREKMIEQNAKLNYSASSDPLTGLFNRRGIMDQMAREVALNEGRRACIVIGDLDHLKEINDTFGHGEGDFAIKAAAELLWRGMGEGAPLGRIGGDEFLGLSILDEDIDEEAFIKKRIADLKLSAELFNSVSGKPYYLGVSVGTYVFTCKADTVVNQLVKYADEELYTAKKSRRETVVRDVVDDIEDFDIDESLFSGLDGDAKNE